VTNPLSMRSWSPYAVGVGIGLLSWFALASADHLLGISTAFENTAALTEKAIVPGVEQMNGYFAAKDAEGKPPKIGWEWMLVVGVFVGALVSSRLSGDRSPETVPALWRWRFGGRPGKRLVVAFLAGAVMMFGARLAQGCTSGHGISGSLQLAASSWVFSAVFFAAATVAAFAIYGKRGGEHV
jgi:uncharacterized protein